jgi:hypothetical protein
LCFCSFFHFIDARQMAIVRNHMIMLITIVLHAGINHFGIFLHSTISL